MLAGTSLASKLMKTAKSRYEYMLHDIPIAQGTVRTTECRASKRRPMIPILL